MRFGIHVHSQGSLEKTARKAHELGCNTFQIFSSSPRTWRGSSVDPHDARRMRLVREELDLHPLAIHCNYLINLASQNDAIRAQSIAAFRGELERAVAIGAEYLVLHPGNHKGQTLEEGLLRFVQGAAEGARGLESGGVTLLVEGTAGSGSAIGSRFEELRAIREVMPAVTALPVAYCLDTCHLLAAGFDIASAAGLRATVQRIDEVLGIANVRLFHANDSKGELGSHLDRHDNIGKGCIGEDGFRRILRHPKLRGKPFILETPMEDDAAAKRDLATLRRLAARRGGSV